MATNSVTNTKSHNYALMVETGNGNRGSKQSATAAGGLIRCGIYGKRDAEEFSQGLESLLINWLG
jgi:hypothetical protein